MDDNITIISTANRSSTISTANTWEANLRWRRPRSVSAVRIIVVNDIDSIPPRNMLLIFEKPSSWPILKPAIIIPTTMISAVTIADPPVLSSFLKLNSSPREKSRTTMPISAQKSMLSAWATVGRYVKFGLARKPATIYPNTTGCLIHLNNTVTMAPRMSMNARSEMRDSIIDDNPCFSSVGLTVLSNRWERFRTSHRRVLYNLRFLCSGR